MKHFLIHSFSEAGRGKPNQDAVLYTAFDDKVLLAIADGMGGEQGGEVASKIAVETVLNEFKQKKNLESIFSQVKANIEDFASHHSFEFERMGTTLTVAIIDGNEVEVGHVGDTRLYHIHDNELIARTKDQTELQKLLDLGILTQARAKSYHRRNVLLSALTPTGDYEFQSNHFKIYENDKLLLLTDGAYSLVDNAEITELSQIYSKTESYASELKKMISSREVKDDYSAIVMHKS